MFRKGHTTYSSRFYAKFQFEDPNHYSKILRHLKPQKNDRILEIGCSRGYTVQRVQNIASQTYGVDINPKAIQNGLTSNLQTMDAEQLTFEDESFNKIYSIHVIEHIPNISKSFQEMSRVLKPGGTILLVYPAEPIRGLFSVYAALMLYRNPFRTRDIHLHKLNPDKIQTLISDTALEHVTSEFTSLLTPQYYTLLKKKG